MYASSRRLSVWRRLDYLSLVLQGKWATVKTYRGLDQTAWSASRHHLGLPQIDDGGDADPTPGESDVIVGHPMRTVAAEEMAPPHCAALVGAVSSQVPEVVATLEGNVTPVGLCCHYPFTAVRRSPVCAVMAWRHPT